MERFEEKIIDLVDVITEIDSDHLKGIHPTPVSAPKMEPPEKIDLKDLEPLVRTEVERLIRSTIDENIRKMIREVLVQEVEKAIAREIENLKQA